MTRDYDDDRKNNKIQDFPKKFIKLEVDAAAEAKSNKYCCKQLTKQKLEIVKKELNIKEWDKEKVTINELITTIIDKTNDIEVLYVADIGSIIRQWQKWFKNLPNITPYYAVKCNPNNGILRVLDALGANYDCASKTEIETVLNLGVDPSRIIFANPCKQISTIKFARKYNVKMMTFDNVCELEKIEKLFPEAELILRVATDDSKSVTGLSTKFGAHIDDCFDLLEIAQEMKLKVVGVSFHVGSDCFDSDSYTSAITMVKRVFDMAKRLGMELTLVDIGGGFPGSKDELFEKFSTVIRNLTAELFDSSVTIIAEPGRYFATQSLILAVSVVSKRIIKKEDNRQHLRCTTSNCSSSNSRHYYLADGYYGSFSSYRFENPKPTPYLLKPSNKQTTLCTLFGPTCDSIDVIESAITIPELDIGDWLYFKDMGSYSIACSSLFNGFQSPPVYYYDSEYEFLINS